MAYSIMEALFDGRIIPWERRNVPTPERKALVEKIQNEKRYFIEKMSQDDCQRFQALQDLYTEASYGEETDIYSHGFTLGALLMQEVLAKKDTMVNE